MENSMVNQDLAKHICTSVAYVQDSENNITTYNSVIHDKIVGKEPKHTNQEIKDEIR